jgi:methionyl-tRNA synthetase
MPGTSEPPQPVDLQEKVDTAETKEQTAKLVEAALKSVDAPPSHGPTSIEYADFAKVELRFGTVQEAVKVPKSDKLLKLTVDLGEAAPRTIVAGIGKTFTDPSALVGRQFLFVTNLAPRKVMGVESHGMMLAAGDGPDALFLASPSGAVTPGSQAR